MLFVKNMLSEKINQSTAYTTKMRESVTNVVQQIEQYEESGLSTGLIDALCTVLSQQNNSEIHNHDESISNAAERGLAIIVRRSDNIDESLQDSSIWKTTAHVLNREDVDRHTKENLLSSIGLIGIQLEFASKQGMNSAQGINELKESIHTFVSKKDENVKYGVAQRKAESLLVLLNDKCDNLQQNKKEINYKNLFEEERKIRQHLEQENKHLHQALRKKDNDQIPEEIDLILKTEDKQQEKDFSSPISSQIFNSNKKSPATINQKKISLLNYPPYPQHHESISPTINEKSLKDINKKQNENKKETSQNKQKENENENEKINLIENNENNIKVIDNLKQQNKEDEDIGERNEKPKTKKRRNRKGKVDILDNKIDLLSQNNQSQINPIQQNPNNQQLKETEYEKKSEIFQISDKVIQIPKSKEIESQRIDTETTYNQQHQKNIVKINSNQDNISFSSYNSTHSSPNSFPSPSPSSSSSPYIINFEKCASLIQQILQTIPYQTDKYINSVINDLIQKGIFNEMESHLDSIVQQIQKFDSKLKSEKNKQKIVKERKQEWKLESKFKNNQEQDGSDDQNVRVWLDETISQSIFNSCQIIRSLLYQNREGGISVEQTRIPQLLINILTFFNNYYELRYIHVQALSNIVHMGSDELRLKLFYCGIMKLMFPLLTREDDYRVISSAIFTIFYVVRAGRCGQRQRKDQMEKKETIQDQQTEDETPEIQSKKPLIHRFPPHLFWGDLELNAIMNIILELMMKRETDWQIKEKAAVIIGWLYQGAPLPLAAQEIISVLKQNINYALYQSPKQYPFSLQALTGLSFARENHHNIVSNGFLGEMNYLLSSCNCEVVKLGVELIGGLSVSGTKETRKLISETIILPDLSTKSMFQGETLIEIEQLAQEVKYELEKDEQTGIIKKSEDLKKSSNMKVKKIISQSQKIQKEDIDSEQKGEKEENKNQESETETDIKQDDQQDNSISSMKKE